jgi:hypothetical protein
LHSKFVRRVRYFSNLKVIAYFFSRFIRKIKILLPGRFVWKMTSMPKEREKLKKFSCAPHQSMPPPGVPLNLKSSLRVILGIPPYVSRSGILVESDMYFTFTNSAKECNINLEEMNLVTSSYRKSNSSNSIDLERILILDGNFPANSAGPISHAEIAEIRKQGIKVVVDIPDCYYTSDGGDKIEYWLKCSDLVIIHNSRFQNLRSHRVMLWPGFPIAYSPYRSKWAKKRVQISFTGTNHRNRSTYRDGAVRAGIEVPDLMHNRNNPNNSIQKYSEYLRPLKFSKFAFSNGYLSSVESIIVGRALESLACGSVLLYEAGSDLNFFFSEYQDFVPILNVPDLIEKVYFLSENDTLAQTIADNGQKKMLSEFSSSNFWELVLRRLS